MGQNLSSGSTWHPASAHLISFPLTTCGPEGILPAGAAQSVLWHRHGGPGRQPPVPPNMGAGITGPYVRIILVTITNLTSSPRSRLLGASDGLARLAMSLDHKTRPQCRRGRYFWWGVSSRNDTLHTYRSRCARWRLVAAKIRTVEHGQSCHLPSPGMNS